jgi:hypothetical protein
MPIYASFSSTPNYTHRIFHPLLRNISSLSLFRSRSRFTRALSRLRCSPARFIWDGAHTHNITSNSRSLTPPPCCLDDEEEHIREARQQQLCYFFQGLLRLHLIILPSLSLCPMCMEIFLPPSDAHMHARSLFRDDASPKYIYVKQPDVFFKGVKNYKFEPRSLQHSPGNNSTCSEPKSRRSLCHLMGGGGEAFRGRGNWL